MQYFALFLEVHLHRVVAGRLHIRHSSARGSSSSPTTTATTRSSDAVVVAVAIAGVGAASDEVDLADGAARKPRTVQPLVDALLHVSGQG